LVDEKDLKILEMLLANARTPFTDIAREVGISDVAVAKRIKRLENLGIIKKYTILLNYSRLNYVASLTGIDVEPEHLYTITDELKKKGYIKYLALTTGDHSLIAFITARNSAEMSEIHKELLATRGIKRVCPAIIIDMIKY